MNLTMAEAKKDFERGYLTGFVLSSAPSLEGVDGWWMFLNTDRNTQPVLVDAKSKQARVFRTVDAAISAARQIGFRADTLTA